MELIHIDAEIIKDHQGSLAATVHGNTVERLSYDPWGRRRNTTNFGYDNVSYTFDRGYTFHEHYDEFDLINMNGRMYDPVTSSFLSVDQYVQSPENAQGFNRYAYCMNNPLRYVDPSGWLAGGGNTGYFPNTTNTFDPYMFYGGHVPLEPRDLGIRQFETADPIITWMEENSLHGSGNGPKGGWYKDSDGSIKYDPNINPSSLTSTQSYLGPFYLDGNTYYSLFGDVYTMNTVSGQVVYKLETETWKNYVDYLIAGQKFEDEYNKGLHNEWETGPVEKCTDFSGIVRFKTTSLGLSDDKGNKYAFNYAGAIVYFIVYVDPSAMTSKVGCWDISEKSGNGNYFGTSGELSGYNVILNTYGNDPMKNSSANKNYVVKMVFPTAQARINAYNRIITTFWFY